MKHNLTARRVSALLLGAAALTSLPALAQDVPAQQAVPPPAVEAPPAAPDPAPPPVVQTAPPPQAPAVTMAPQSPVVQAVPQAPVAQTPAVTRAVRTTAQTRTTRSVTRTAAPATQPAPTAATQAAPSPAPRSATSPSAADVAPEGPAVSNATSSTTSTVAAPPASEQPAATANGGRTSLSTLLAWGFGIAIALVALGLMWVALRRRNADADGDVYVDQTPRSVRAPVMVEPEALPLATAPLAAAAPPTEQNEPVFATEAQETVASDHVNGAIQHELHPAESAMTHDADAEDLTGIADGGAPVADRPWLEFGIRPLRAGTSHKDAMVEVELIVGNAGDTEAEDVRISTFMLASGSTQEMDHILTEHLSDASAEPVNIAPGEGTCVDAILSVSRTELNGDQSFEPIVIAEARYKLADGSEGRTSAAFKLGVTDDKGDRFDPINLDRAEIFHTIAAQLHGTPEHV